MSVLATPTCHPFPRDAHIVTICGKAEEMIQCASTICFRAYSLEDALRGVAEAGFQNVELGAVKNFVDHLDADNLGSAKVEELRVLLTHFGLEAVSISGHSDVQTGEGFNRLDALVRAAGELGMLAVNTFTLESADPAQRTAFIANIRSLADRAGEFGVKICLETEGDLLPTAQLGASLLEEIDHPWVKMNFDPANVIFFSGTVRPEDDVMYALPFLGHMHLKDKHGGKGVFDFPPPGEGEIDLDMILSAVQTSGFSGPVSMEVELADTEAPWEACRDALRRGKDYWDRLGI